MKKIKSKKIITLFICICMAVCLMPAAAFAQNSSKDASSKTTSSQSQEKDSKGKEVKKTEISLGSVYKKVYDGKEISKSDVYSLVSTKSGGVSVFTYEWYDAAGNKMDYNPVKAGTYKLKIKVSEKDPSYKGSATVSYVVEQRPLEWDVSQLKISKPYDGTTAPADVRGKLLTNGIIEGDKAELAYDSVTASDFPTPDVQRVSVALKVENAHLTGEDAGNYSLPKLSPTSEAAIIKAVITEISFPGNDNKYRMVLAEEVNVSDALSATEFNSTENIKTALREKISEAFSEKQEYSTVFYTPVLQVVENGEWVDVTEDNMPQDEVTVMLKYPEGTDSDSFDFVVYKMKTKGDEAGSIEVWAHTEKVEGLETVLSQGDILAVGYTPQKQSNMTLIIVIGAVAVMIIAGVVFLKLHKAEKTEAEEAAEEDPEQ